MALAIPVVSPLIVAAVLWPPTNAFSSWSFSTVMIFDMLGCAT